MVDYVAGRLPRGSDRPRRQGHRHCKEDDVAPFFRDFSQKYNGKTYMITLDGDFHMVYYRTDVLEELGLQPPKTWDDYLAIAKAAATART